MRYAAIAWALILGCGSPGRTRPADASADGPEPDANQGAETQRDAIEEEAPDVRRPARCGSGGATVGFPSTDFRPPVVHCHWDRGFDVMSTPMVADLTGDGKPEIVFPAYDYKVHAIDGACADVWSGPLNGVDPQSDLAIGDLDGDGKPEVVGMGRTSMTVWNGQTGTVLAMLASPRVVSYGVLSPSIANVDGVGSPEIVIGTAVLRYAAGVITEVWAQEDHYAVAAVADLDGDGTNELVSAGAIWDAPTGALEAMLAVAPRTVPGTVMGHPAIADYDPDSPGPEIVFVAMYPADVGVYAGSLAAEPGKQLHGPYYENPAVVPASGGGPPAVADFDGDGEPEIGVAGGRAYTVYDRECDAVPTPDKCFAPGKLWQSHTQDQSSWMTTSTVFDFNCDGKAEVVYRDECWLRVYDGATGTVRFATAITSNTAIESAVVADVDGSGHAKIVASANTLSICSGAEEYTGTKFTGLVQGIFILKDPLDRWQATRKIWNQNAYHVTNVNEDGTIPAVEAPSWAGENTYRANVAVVP